MKSSIKDYKKTAVVGGGLVGSLWALMLAKRGLEVDVFERRPDIRLGGQGGRSINLAISNRGLNALSRMGLKSYVLEHAIAMKGRMIHGLDGSVQFQQYGRNDHEVIYSISRSWLNGALITEAQKSSQVKYHFETRLDAVDWNKNELQFDSKNESFDIVFGTDGSASALRQAIQSKVGQENRSDLLEYGYKELTLPSGPDGSFLLEKNALHIWPRKQFMLIALPDAGGTYTCTLFLPFKGQGSFETLKTSHEVNHFFEKEFGDIKKLIPDIEKQFFNNPTGEMFTVRSYPWVYEDRACLMGDAAHAIVPFFGQGMNCGFEDCAILDELLDQTNLTYFELFQKYQNERKPNADAIAQMAIENFIEMRDRVADPKFLLQKKVEAKLQEAFPEKYLSRYTLVSFSLTPYKVAYEVGMKQEKIISELCKTLTSVDQFDPMLLKQWVEGEIEPYLKGKIKYGS